MTTFNNLIASGASAALAKAILGIQTSAIAAGTTQDTATQLLTDDVIITDGEPGEGYRIPIATSTGDTFKVANDSGNELIGYPPLGSQLSIVLSIDQGSQHVAGQTLWYTARNINPLIYDIRFGT